MSDFEKRAKELEGKLDMIDAAVLKSAGRFDDMRDKADQVFETRVEQLAEIHNVDMSRAHALAVDDPIAKRAYAVSQELAERQDHAFEAGGQIARYIE